MKYLLLLLLLLSTSAFAQFTPFPPVPVAPDTLVTKGGLLTSNGSNQLEALACADTEILVYDAADAKGFKCEANEGGVPLMAKGSLVSSNGISNLEVLACADGEVIVWDSAEVHGYRCETKTSGGTPLMLKGALFTSNGVNNGQSIACADGEKIEWDAAEDQGFKCVPSQPTLTKGEIIVSDGPDNVAFKCANGEVAKWNSTFPEGIECETLSSGGPNVYVGSDFSVATVVSPTGVWVPVSSISSVSVGTYIEAHVEPRSTFVGGASMNSSNGSCDWRLQVNGVTVWQYKSSPGTFNYSPFIMSGTTTAGTYTVSLDHYLNDGAGGCVTVGKLRVKTW